MRDLAESRMRVAFCAGGSVWLQAEVLAEEDAQ